MRWFEWFYGWLVARRSHGSVEAVGLAAETGAMAQRVNELGAQARQLADWWANDAKANHYAERIREAYRAEITGQQPKVGAKNEGEGCEKC